MRYIEFNADQWPVPRRSANQRVVYLLLGTLGGLWTMTSHIYDELRWEVFE